MKYLYVLLIFFLFFSCNQNKNIEEEEFDYYEPIIGEEFQTVSDQTRMVEYDYSNKKELVVETVDANGIKYSVVIPSSATGPLSSEPFGGYIAPITDIQNLPEGVEFQFGLEIEPYGIRFIKPVEIKIELPGNFDTQNLRGFYNEGHGGIAYLEPLKIRKKSGSTEAIFEVFHFSSYGGIKVDDNDFDCPDPRSAQTCENLREIIACKLGVYEVGINEELNQKDQESINNILKTWMEHQLEHADWNSVDYSDLFEFEYELSQYICWKAMTQEFNSDPEIVFGRLFNQAEEYIIEVIVDIMQEADSLCINKIYDDECLTGYSKSLTESFIQWLGIAQELGIEEDPRIPDMNEFCNNSITNILENFTVVHSGTFVELPTSDGYPNESFKSYIIEFESPGQVINLDYYMTNLLDELVDINESEIKWDDVSEGAALKGAYEYSKGAITMNKQLQQLIAMTSESETYIGLFKVYKNDCYKANVIVAYTKN